MPRPRLTLVLVLATATAACIGGRVQTVAVSSVTPRADSAVLVTRLGGDTLVVERIVRTPRRVEADVVIRVPRTAVRRYALDLDEAGNMTRFEVRTSAVGVASPTSTSVMTRVGDSLRTESVQEGQAAPQVRTALAPVEVLPFIDMVHWPYELALARLRDAGREIAVPLLAGGRPSAFRFAAIGDDSATITHPTRGTMRARIDATGRLLGLDAAATTRKLVVERTRWTDLAPLAQRWAALDAAGRSLGDLSGRNRPSFTVHGAAIAVDHGTPVKRGRAIWGALVPYGQVWRTGANMATHFTTDRALTFGSGADTLRVPAGRYTLFSVPDSAGGLLIVNRQVDITGTAHDPAYDLGRVRMTARPLASEVEVFDIVVTAGTAPRGELRLQWDRRELVAPFVVR